jgi:hypothetical protein
VRITLVGCRSSVVGVGAMEVQTSLIITLLRRSNIAYYDMFAYTRVLHIPRFYCTGI